MSARKNPKLKDSGLEVNPPPSVAPAVGEAMRAARAAPTAAGVDFGFDGVITPPTCNTGVNYPSRGQNLPLWRLDWLRLSFPESDIDEVANCLTRNGFHPEPSKGKHGYSRGYGFKLDILAVQPDLFIWWGGDAMQGKATIEIPATYAETVFLAISRLAVPFLVRRLDLCLDFDGVPFLSGQDAIVHTLENWPYTGRRPLYHKIDDMGQGTGSTLYVGRRDGDCMIRWYQKGLQMRDPFRPNWCRFEIELKPSKPEVAALFWSMLKQGRRSELAASGFSAAFLPFFTGVETVSKSIDVPPSPPRTFDDRIISMVTQWGGLFGEMLERTGGDRAEVADMIFEAMKEKARRQNLVRLAGMEANPDTSEIPY